MASQPTGLPTALRPVAEIQELINMACSFSADFGLDSKRYRLAWLAALTLIPALSVLPQLARQAVHLPL